MKLHFPDPGGCMNSKEKRRLKLRALIWGGVAAYALIPAILLLLVDAESLWLVLAVWILIIAEVFSALLYGTAAGLISRQEDQKEALLVAGSLVLFFSLHCLMIYSRVLV